MRSSAVTFIYSNCNRIYLWEWKRKEKVENYYLKLLIVDKFKENKSMIAKWWTSLTLNFQNDFWILTVVIWSRFKIISCDFIRSLSSRGISSTKAPIILSTFDPYYLYWNLKTKFLFLEIRFDVSFNSLLGTTAVTNSDKIFAKQNWYKKRLIHICKLYAVYQGLYSGSGLSRIVQNCIQFWK